MSTTHPHRQRRDGSANKNTFTGEWKANRLTEPRKTKRKKSKIMKFPVPKQLAQEHEALHGELPKALKASGQTAAAAKALVEVLHGHFVKEDELAMPPLGLLPELARGQVPAHTKNILPLTDKLREELPVFLKEHYPRGGEEAGSRRAQRGQARPGATGQQTPSTCRG